MPYIHHERYGDKPEKEKEHVAAPMAVANSLDWSLASTITRKTVQFSHHSAANTKIGFRFISILFSNSNPPRAARADSSAVLEDDVAVGDSPVIELALKLEDFQHLPEDDADCKELNSIICSLFEDPQTEHLAYDYYQKAKTEPDFKPQKYTMKLAVSSSWIIMQSLLF